MNALIALLLSVIREFEPRNNSLESDVIIPFPERILNRRGHSAAFGRNQEIEPRKGTE